MKERIPEVRAAPPDDDERSAGGVARGDRAAGRRGMEARIVKLKSRV